MLEEKIRNSKSEIRNNSQNSKLECSKQAAVLGLESWSFEFVSSFDIRISCFAGAAGSRLLLQACDNADERREESEHDRTDHHRQEYNHEGFERRGESYHGVINLVVIDVGDL